LRIDALNKPVIVAETLIEHAVADQLKPYCESSLEGHDDFLGG